MYLLTLELTTSFLGTISELPGKRLNCCHNRTIEYEKSHCYAACSNNGLPIFLVGLVLLLDSDLHVLTIMQTSDIRAN